MQTRKNKLGIRRLVLQIHDASFPSCADEEVGRGSPYSAGARDFLSFAQSLGFEKLVVEFSVFAVALSYLGQVKNIHVLLPFDGVGAGRRLTSLTPRNSPVIFRV